MTKAKALLRTGLAGLLAHALLPGAAVAQTAPLPSQLPPGEEVERRSPEARFDLRIGAGTQARPGAEAVALTVASAELAGDMQGLPPPPAHLLPQRGQNLTLAEVYGAAAALQQHYIDAGYPLVRVFLPVQDLDRGAARITIRLVSGRIAEIAADALPGRVRGAVTRYLRPLVGRANPTLAQIERAVLLAGEVAGLTLSSALAPGKETGETVLIASGEYRPFEAILSADDRLAPELGGEQVTASIALNSLAGKSERIALTLASAASDLSFGSAVPRRYAGLYVDLPIGSNGLAAGMDAMFSTSRPGGAFAGLQFDSRFRRASVRLAYPIVRSRRFDLHLRAQGDWSEDESRSLLLGFPVVLSRDDTRVLRLGLAATRRTGRSGFLGLEVEFARGIAALGARRASDASASEPLSRVGADATFSRVSADLRAEVGAQRLPVALRLRASGQSGLGKPLLRSEQLSVTTPDLVSGPPTGVLVGDSAIAARGELAVAGSVRPFGLEVYGFGAAAYSRLEQPTALERGETRLEAGGMGLRATLPLAGRLRLSGQVEVSHTGGNEPLLAGNWLTFQTALRF